MDPITLSTATDRQSITVGTCNLSSEVSALCFAFLAEEASLSTEFPVLLPQTFYNNSTLIKLLDIEMTRKQRTDMDVSLKGFKISENDYGARSVEMKRRSALFETAQRSILDQVT